MGSVIRNGGSNDMRKSFLEDRFKNIQTFKEFQEFLHELYRSSYRLKTKRKGNRPTNFKKYMGDENIVRYDYTVEDYKGKCKIENLYRYFKIV